MRTSRLGYIPFNNADRFDDEKICAAFAAHALRVADISSWEATQNRTRTDLRMWVWVLAHDGSLWLLDQSHGGGGRFELHSR